MNVSLRDAGYDQSIPPFERIPPFEQFDYSLHHHLPPFVKRGAVPIEIHHALAPRNSPFSIDPTALWERSSNVSLAGTTVRVLSTEDLLLHLCIHAAYNHRFTVPLRALYDIDAVTRRLDIDWTRLAAIACEQGTGRFAYCTLLVARRLFGTAIPVEILECLPHRDADGWVVDVVCENLFVDTPELPVVCKQWMRRAGWRDGMRRVWATVFPPREWPAETARPARVKPTANWSYFVRPLEMVVRRRAAAAGMILQTHGARTALRREAQRIIIERWAADGTWCPRPPNSSRHDEGRTPDGRIH